MAERGSRRLGRGSVTGDRAAITFGALSRPLALLKRFFDVYPEEAPMWNEIIGLDVAVDGTRCCALIEIALMRNQGGPVLVTASNTDHVDTLASLAVAPALAVDPEVMRGFYQLLASAQERIGYRGAAA